MDSLKKKYVSLFDIIEEQSSSPCPFNWLPYIKMSLPYDDFIYESGLLFARKSGDELKSRRCTLFRSCLIKYSVLTLVTMK